MSAPQVSRFPASGNVILVAHVFAKAGKESRILELVSAVRKQATENEDGNLTYRVTQSIDDNGAATFVIFEEYSSQAAIDAHFASDQFQALVKAVGEEDLIDASKGGIKTEFYEEHK